MHNTDKKGEKGAFAIEAVLGLTLFMLAVMSIMSMSFIIRVQANMQYALGQTAKEISGYYYLMDKLGIASITSGSVPESTQNNINDLDKTIGSILDFGSGMSNTVSGVDFSDGLDAGDLQTIAGNTDIESLKEQASAVGANLKTYAQEGTALEQLKAVIQVFGKSLVSKSFSYYVAPLVCQALLPKYLTSNPDVDEYYESVGIDPESVDFSGSQLLLDGRSIKLVVEYEMDTEKLTLGMYKGKIKFHQVATTAAWIKPNGDSKRAIADIEVPDDESEEPTE